MYCLIAKAIELNTNKNEGTATSTICKHFGKCRDKISNDLQNGDASSWISDEVQRKKMAVIVLICT